MLIMRKMVVLAFSFLLFTIIAGQSAFAKIIHVKQGSSGNGSSWANAYGILQEALDDANSGDEIWIAAGTYKPTYDYDLGISSRGNHFRMINGVSIYGGFPNAGDPVFTNRDPVTHVTILSGDINSVSVNTDNCYHIFYHPTGLNLNSTALLDGVTITDGYANGGYPHDHGGGMCNLNSNSPKLVNCILENNQADDGGGMCNMNNCSPTIMNSTFRNNMTLPSYNNGGGIYNYDDCSPTLTNCLFENNSASNGGGMYSFLNCDPVLTDCTFRNNSSDYGGGMYNYGVDGSLTNCTFDDNFAEYNGGGMYTLSSYSTLTDCNFINNWAYDHGAGLANRDSEPWLTSCDFDNNIALNKGGGLFNDWESDARLIDCTFSNNWALGEGGAVANYDRSSPILNNCTFDNNKAESEIGDATGGGAINNDLYSHPELTDCTFTNNTTDGSGGGMLNQASSNPTLNRCSFEYNTSVSNGGAITDSITDSTIIDCDFEYNTTLGKGGALYFSHGSPNVINSLFNYNEANSGGGGICIIASDPNIINCLFTHNQGYSNDGGGLLIIGDSQVTITNSTFARNSSYYGGGLHVRDNNNTIIRNSIFWENYASFNGHEIYNVSSSPLISYCNIDGSGGSDNWDPNTGMDEGNNVDNNPLFIDPNSYPGNFRLSSGSPCINAGNTSALPQDIYDLDNDGYTDEPIALDLDALKRVAIVVDMGAFEFQQNIYTQAIHVNALATGNNDGSTWQHAFTDLQQALDTAELEMKPIWIAEGTYYPNSDYGLGIGDRGKHFRMINGVAIYGGFAATGNPAWEDRDPETHETILSGDIGVAGDPSDNCYHVFYHPLGTNLDNTAILDGVTVTAGDAVSSYPHNYGGGMYNSFCAPTIKNCMFSDNGAGNGGGMYNDSSSPMLTDCTFNNNSTFSSNSRGGGMCNNSSSPTLTNCTFSSNSVESGEGGGGLSNFNNSNPQLMECTFTNNSTNGRGGGMYNLNNSSPTLTNCTYSSNTANSGGGIYNDYSNPALANCTFSNNSAESEGGGIYNYNSDATLDNCTFGGNSATNSYGAGNGGGVFNEQSEPSLTNCTFSNNSADSYGGGMRNSSYGNPTLTNCTFSNNSANYCGGGMSNFNNSSPQLTGCNFTDNSASNGGGIHNNGSCNPTLTNCEFGNNSAYDEFGGGIYNHQNSNPILTDCMFSGNSAVNNGGGMYNSSSANSMLTNCTFNNNSANYGGGISNDQSSAPIIINCIFLRNVAEIEGGGMYNSGAVTLTNALYSGNVADSGGGIYSNGGLTITNCTLSGNTAKVEGGGIYADGGGDLSNCILWGNTASNGQQIYNYNNPGLMISYCDIAGCGGSGTSWNSSVGEDIGGNIDDNPLFVHDPNNGGDGWGDDPNTPDVDEGANDNWGNLHLQTGSPCIDIGDNNAVPPDTYDLDDDGDNSEPIPYDLDGKVRITDGDYSGTATVDMGAYEIPRVIHVDKQVSGGNDNGTSWIDAFDDLSEALNIAVVGDEIWVAKGTYCPNPNGLVDPREASFQMKNGVAIYGGFAAIETSLALRNVVNNVTILSGDLLGNDDPNIPVIELLDDPSRGDNCYHVFYHPSGTHLNSTAILDGVTIKGGNATTGTSYDRGGGMYNEDSSSPMLANCTFNSNSAGYAGGGMYNDINSSPTLTNCIFSNNSANYCGGGVANWNESSQILSNCMFSGNLAVNEGGGMCNIANSSPTLTSCMFTGNQSDSFGGGISNRDYSSPILINCTFSDNSALDGGGILNDNNSNSTLTNCTFSRNSAENNGGGMFNLVNCAPTITNCIFWDNSALNGNDEIHNDFGSTPVINYCDIENSNGSGSGWNLSFGTDLGGNIDVDPLFVDVNDLHLKSYSLCINAGNPAGSYIGQTDFDEAPRVRYDRVDMGAYEVFPIAGDFNEPSIPDEDVDLFDLAYFVQRWLSSPCSEPDYCEGADIDSLGSVDFVDFAYIAQHWMYGVE